MIKPSPKWKTSNVKWKQLNHIMFFLCLQTTNKIRRERHNFHINKHEQSDKLLFNPYDTDDKYLHLSVHNGKIADRKLVFHLQCTHCHLFQILIHK